MLCLSHKYQISLGCDDLNFPDGFARVSAQIDWIRETACDKVEDLCPQSPSVSPTAQPTVSPTRSPSDSPSAQSPMASPTMSPTHKVSTTILS